LSSVELPSIKCPRMGMFVDKKTCIDCEYHLKEGRKHYCRFVDPYSVYIKLWEDSF